VIISSQKIRVWKMVDAFQIAILSARLRDWPDG
jgi:hypothetical protein